jgi:hypothetical protein
MTSLRMDLKVCEGCGALWLRMDGVCSVYCRGCARQVSDFPAPRPRHAGGRRCRTARTAELPVVRERSAGEGSAMGLAGGGR